MNELNDKDWELVNAYHDGELGDAERLAFESRLESEPALNEALGDVSGVSASLGSLRPERQPTSSPQTGAPANAKRQRARWLVGGAVAAAITLALALGPPSFTEPSMFDVHADFAAQTFAVEGGDVRPVVAWESLSAPDLFSANLTPVAMRHVEDGHVTHYAGRNGCRLSYFRGKFNPDDQTPTTGVQVASWSTTNNVDHMIVATGMDQGKFDAIAEFLKLLTQRQASEQMMASLTEATANAERCVT